MEGAENIVDGVKRDDVKKVASGLVEIENSSSSNLDAETGIALALAHEYSEDEGYEGIEEYADDIIDEYYSLESWRRVATAVGAGVLSAGAYQRFQGVGFEEVSLFLAGCYAGFKAAPVLHSLAQDWSLTSRFADWDYEEDFLKEVSQASNYQFTDVSEEAQRHLLDEYGLDTFGNYSGNR